MALTYEDWNDAQAANFDSTANALLRGIADYLDIEPSAIEDDPIRSVKFELLQNYPNPFNPRTILNYELPIANHVELSIYNVLGQKVAVLVSETQQVGKYTVEWDASQFSSGVYYYMIKTDNFRKVKRMILIR